MRREEEVAGEKKERGMKGKVEGGEGKGGGGGIEKADTGLDN